MTVNLTRIYTKLGDAGQTHLGDMSRVSKLDPRVEAYGTVDELNATIGLALLASGVPERVSEWLRRIQNDLLDLGADLCVPPAEGEGLGGFEGATEGENGAAAEVDASTKRSVREPSEIAAAETDASTKRSVRERPARSRLRITPEYVEWLEQACDEVNEKLPPLHSFVIPGGTEASARLHICRTVCRRAERRSLAVSDANPEVVRYLNRLSDLLFILARAANEGAGSGPEALWAPGEHGGGVAGSG